MSRLGGAFAGILIKRLERQLEPESWVISLFRKTVDKRVGKKNTAVLTPACPRIDIAVGLAQRRQHAPLIVAILMEMTRPTFSSRISGRDFFMEKSFRVNRRVVIFRASALSASLKFANDAPRKRLATCGSCAGIEYYVSAPRS